MGFSTTGLSPEKNASHLCYKWKLLQKKELVHRGDTCSGFTQYLTCVWGITGHFWGSSETHREPPLGCMKEQFSSLFSWLCWFKRLPNSCLTMEPLAFSAEQFNSRSGRTLRAALLASWAAGTEVCWRAPSHAFLQPNPLECWYPDKELYGQKQLHWSHWRRFWSSVGTEKHQRHVFGI